jgi:mannose-6-phosphate isomerase
MGIQVERVQQTVLRRDWGEEIFIAATPHYLGKILKMKAGTKGGMQFHQAKDETFVLWSGMAIVRSDDGTGKLQETIMRPGESYHIPPGAPHQVEAVDDCILFEASTPHYDDRVRCDEQYGLTNDGGLQTTR